MNVRTISLLFIAVLGVVSFVISVMGGNNTSHVLTRLCAIAGTFMGTFSMISVMQQKFRLHNKEGLYMLAGLATCVIIFIFSGLGNYLLFFVFGSLAASVIINKFV